MPENQPVAPPWRVLAFAPDGPDGNPYLGLLYGALGAQGVTLDPITRFDAAAMSRADRSTTVHLHWLEHLTAATGPLATRLARAHLRLGRTARAIGALKRRGGRLVWTVHNLFPHERPFPWIDALMNRLVLATADGVVVHSEYAASRLAATYRLRCPVWVAPHGHYVDSYPPATTTRPAAREALGLPPDGRLLLAFGQVRAYKQLPQVIAAFRAVAAPADTLVVAGYPPLESDRSAVVTAAGGDPRVVLRLERISAADVPVYHAAADGAIVGYREVFSSGALMLALSLGVPVLAPRQSSAVEIVTPAAGILFDDGGLRGGLEEMLTRAELPSPEAARTVALEYGWDRTASHVRAAYLGVDPDRRP